MIQEKICTFVVPCYKSAAYMEKCIDSILPGGDDIEILIIDDGSVGDDTGAIADRYAAAYPGVVQAVHKENGGHGSGINCGIERASGRYFKVVDSDDWLDAEALPAVLDFLRAQPDPGVDMLVTDYRYEHAETNSTYTVDYRNVFPTDRLFGWDDMLGNFRPWQYMMMHSVIYRTAVLRECGVRLPEHTFYVDNLFMYAPFPHVHTIYYMNIPLYHYFIGRSDQSITERAMSERVGQQHLVTELMMHAADLPAIKRQSKALFRCMKHELAMMFLISTIFTHISRKTTPDRAPENYRRLRGLWRDLKESSPKTYRLLRYRTLTSSIAVFMPRHMLLFGYRRLSNILKYN